MAALRRHPGLIALLAIYLVVAGIALWLAPLLGGIMFAAVGVFGLMYFTYFLPSMLKTDLYGPGYQHRDEGSKPRD